MEIAVIAISVTLMLGGIQILEGSKLTYPSSERMGGKMGNVSGFMGDQAPHHERPIWMTLSVQGSAISMYFVDREEYEAGKQDNHTSRPSTYDRSLSKLNVSNDSVAFWVPSGTYFVILWSESPEPSTFEFRWTVTTTEYPFLWIGIGTSAVGLGIMAWYGLRVRNAFG